MKRASCLMLIAIPIFVYSQHYRFEVGAESGPALGRFWSNVLTPDHFTSNTYYSAGTFFRYWFSPHLALQTGLYNEMIGTSDEIKAKSTSSGYKPKVNVSQHVNYMTMPFLFRLSFGNRLKGNFVAGSFISVLTSHKTVWDYGDHREAFNNTKNTNWFNAGIVWGGGLEYNVIPQMNIGIEVRNQMGFVNMDPKASMAYFRTNSLQILLRVGYQFKWVEKKEKKKEGQDVRLLRSR
jgi:hypothetical protein